MIKVHYLCSECAIKHGGVWPEGHVATTHMSPCNICGREVYLASVRDWDWPAGLKYFDTRGAMPRD